MTEREHLENLATNAEHTGVPPEVHAAAVDAALQAYAQAHRAIPVFNRAQLAAREAAVALGEKRYADAVMWLNGLKQHLDQGPEHWAEYARAFDPELAAHSGMSPADIAKFSAPAEAPRFSRAPEGKGGGKPQPKVRIDSIAGGEFDWRRGETLGRTEPGFYLTGVRHIAERMPDSVGIDQFLANLKSWGVKKEELEEVWEPLVESRRKQGDKSISRSLAFNWGEDMLNAVADPHALGNPEHGSYTGPGTNYRVTLEMGRPDREPYRTHFGTRDIAHLRTKDVVDAQGRPLLYIEETQSDLHQAAANITNRLGFAT
jgi:hypothetical protein